MDYSSYYLKNYNPDKDGAEPYNYCNSYYKYYCNEREMIKNEPVVIYTQPTSVRVDDVQYNRADIEYVPDEGVKETPVRAGSDTRKKGGKIKHRLWLFALCVSLIALSCLSTLLATDIITDGKVIDVMRSAFSAEKSVYVSYIEGFADYDSARACCDGLRSEGYGGFLYSDGKGGYKVYLDISEQDDIVVKNTLTDYDIRKGAIVLEEFPSKKIDKNTGDKLKKYNGYCEIFLGYMFELLEGVQSGALSVSSLPQEIKNRHIAYRKLCESFSEDFESDALPEKDRIASDMSINEAALDVMSKGSYADYSDALADMRYYAIQAVFNYNALCAALNK